MPSRAGHIIKVVATSSMLSFAALFEVCAETKPVVISATPIPSFDLNHPGQSQFGELEFVGGLVLRSDAKDFGAFSGLRISNTGLLTSVTDTGYWLQGKIDRNNMGTPLGISQAQMAPLLDSQGTPFGNKWYADAESLTFSDNFAFVGMEQNTRLLRFEINGNLLSSKSIRLQKHRAAGVFKSNNGYEAVATFPKSHSLHGNILVLREYPAKNANENVGQVYNTNGTYKGAFEVLGVEPFAITDADFLPSGDLLLLERRFTMGWGAQIRIRRIKGIDVKVGSKLQGDVILKAGNNQQLDNMEGLSIFRGPSGKLRIGLISDNNHWPMQRTLYLEFKLNN